MHKLHRCRSRALPVAGEHEQAFPNGLRGFTPIRGKVPTDFARYRPWSCVLLNLHLPLRGRLGLRLLLCRLTSATVRNLLSLQSDRNMALRRFAPPLNSLRQFTFDICYFVVILP
jgi:hypothetical protein